MSRIKRIGVVTLATFLLGAALSASAQAMIFVKIPNIGDNSVSLEYDSSKWLTAGSFSFGVEREMKEPGEKASVALSLAAGPEALELLAASIAGTSIGDMVIEFHDESAAEGKPICYLRYKLDRVFVKSWSTSGDADDRPGDEVRIELEFDSIVELR